MIKKVDPELHRAWTSVVTADDYEQHMAAVGQALAAGVLSGWLIRRAAPRPTARVVVAGAGTGQMLDYLDARLLAPFRLVFSDLNPGFLQRLRTRLAQRGLTADIIQDDIERTSLAPRPDLLLATLLLEHIDWRRGVDTFAGLCPVACGVIVQENPPGMTSAVTPGRTVPPSIAEAMRTAHARLVPAGELEAAFAAHGYRCLDRRSEDVADGKRLVAMLFVPRQGRVE
jgi:hypothetical protein